VTPESQMKSFIDRSKLVVEMNPWIGGLFILVDQNSTKMHRQENTFEIVKAIYKINFTNIFTSIFNGTL
jgi:hypothetical protein